LNAFHKRNRLHTCFVSEARGHQISSDFYAQPDFPAIKLSNFEVKEDGCFYLLCVHSTKGF